MIQPTMKPEETNTMIRSLRKYGTLEEPMTVRAFVQDYLQTNKTILRQNKKQGKLSTQYASLACGLAQALVQYYGGNENFEIPLQPNEVRK